MISGLQKLTLLDYPGCVAATVFTQGCNLRCPFCHNASLVVRPAESGISLAEFEEFLKRRSGILDGICVTGGEPLIHPEIRSLLELIRSYGFKIKLDTNGFFPDTLVSLVNDGLVDYVAMDIKSSPEGYPLACGKTDVDILPIIRSIEFLINGSIPYEFRTTAVGGIHTAKDFAEIGRLIQGAERYYIQIYTDSGDIIKKEGLSAPSAEDAEAFLTAVKPFVGNAALRGI